LKERWARKIHQVDLQEILPKQNDQISEI